MSKMFSEKYYEDAEDEDEHEIEANKAIDMKLLQDKGEELEPDCHDYLNPEDKLKGDFEEKMGKSVTEKA